MRHLPTSIALSVAVGIAGLVVGCTGTREGAAEQLRSAIASDTVPAQYEPPIEDAGDDFEPDFE